MPEVRILEALSLFDQLTAEQLSRHLTYSFRYTQGKCKDLTEGKYLQRLTLPKRTHTGSVPYVYSLGRRGRDFLKNHNEAAYFKIKQRYRPSEETARLHRLAINEVLLQAIKITKEDPSLSLVRYISDREFRDEPIQVTLPTRAKPETVTLIPDLWIHLEQRKEGKIYTDCFCIEVNLTPVEQKRWRRKIALYLNCSDAYTKRVGMDVLRVVSFLAHPATVLRKGTGSYSEKEREEREAGLAASCKRLSDFLAWTEKELVSQNREEDADLFLFTSASLDSFTPQDMLFEPHYVVPFEKEPTALIPQA